MAGLSSVLQLPNIKKSAVKYNGLASGGHDEEESVRKEERKEIRK